MTLREQLRHMVSGRGLEDREVDWLLDVVIKETREANVEFANDWDKDMKEVEQFQQEDDFETVLLLLWRLAQQRVKELMYWRMWHISGVIQQFEKEHPYR